MTASSRDDLRFQAGFAVSGQPADDLIDLNFGAILTLRFLNIQRVHLGKFCSEDSMLGHFLVLERFDPGIDEAD
jgi:hypothetical protein